MRKPIHKHLNKDGSSRLFFDGKTDYRDYYMRGGICWPVTDAPGYILLAGQDIETKKVWIFEEQEFLVINHILDEETSTIEYRGVAPFFVDCWARYFGRKYYWKQGWDLHRSFRLEITRSKAVINPQPIIVEIKWPDDSDVAALIWKYMQLGRLKVQKESRLAEELRGAATTDKEISPPIHALQCLLAGIEKYPWRKRG
jgi:hypothetical protein